MHGFLSGAVQVPIYAPPLDTHTMEKIELEMARDMQEDQTNMVVDRLCLIWCGDP